MLTLDRRGLVAGFSAFIGTALAAPLSRALAADPVPGFAASYAVFTPDQHALVAAVGGRILPATDTPGAIEAGVPAFMEMMLADWYAAGDRDDFLTGLTQLDAFARAQHAKAFAVLAPAEQDAVLTCAMNGMMPGLAPSFFEHCRQMVLLGYYTSEIGATRERVYVPVPGHYDGAYPYARVKRIFSA